VNPGIRAAFISVHHCPFLHTGGIYPHDLQNTWLATTSNDELSQEEDRIALLFVEEVYCGEHFHISLVPERVALLMGHLHHVRDTSHICRQELAEMSLSAIGKWMNPPKYHVAIHRTIVETRHCDPLCLPILTKNIQATIDEPFILLKHHMKDISPPGPLVLLTHPQSKQDQ